MLLPKKHHVILLVVKLLINKKSIRRKYLVCKGDGINLGVGGKNFNNMLPSSQCLFAKIKYLRQS
jgi:hypothetical protein